MDVRGLGMSSDWETADGIDAPTCFRTLTHAPKEYIVPVEFYSEDIKGGQVGDY